MTVRHIRDGIELEPIVKDENFDYQYQQAVTLSRKTILPVEIFFQKLLNLELSRVTN